MSIFVSSINFNSGISLDNIKRIIPDIIKISKTSEYNSILTGLDFFPVNSNATNFMISLDNKSNITFNIDDLGIVIGLVNYDNIGIFWSSDQVQTLVKIINDVIVQKEIVVIEIKETPLQIITNILNKK